MIPGLFFAVGCAYSAIAWRERDRASGPMLALYVAAAAGNLTAAVVASAVR